ncbi:unnamed protein product [Orchesella dallaii]|uniref:RING-type domain-containing protein n=1 Tax=Orchesella dallaii TaxID=48710 RepID=A0ABP1QA21_9HEXA
MPSTTMNGAASSSSPEIDPDPNVLEEMRRMAYDRSKWLQTYTFIISQYEFNKEEMTQFYSEMCDLLENMKTYLKCPFCKHTIKKSAILPCGHLLCQKCVSRRFIGAVKSQCPTCECEVEKTVPLPVYAVDEITKEIALFLKEARFFKSSLMKPVKENDAKKLLKSMNFVFLQRIKNLEGQLMCDYCFNKLNTTCLVRCAADAFTGRPLCVGCDTKYIRFYQNEQGKTFDEPIQFPTFDTIVSEFYGFLMNVVDYCKSKKVPIRLLNKSGIISLRPVYKLLVAAILIGLFLIYFSN